MRLRVAAHAVPVREQRLQTPFLFSSSFVPGVVVSASGRQDASAVLSGLTALRRVPDFIQSVLLLRRQGTLLRCGAFIKLHPDGNAGIMAGLQPLCDLQRIAASGKVLYWAESGFCREGDTVI